MKTQTDNFLEIFHSIDFQKIKDHPNILIAANFWEEDRFNAAKVCYKYMRTIDDLIDDHKAKNKIIKPEERKIIEAKIDACLTMHEDLQETINRFRIPRWPMEDFARSMIYDIYHNGFSTLESFLAYSRGASVAPASIFVHLNGIKKVNEIYKDPPFDVKWVATPCAIFSYLVHIIRDFQKDQLNNLNSFADELITRYGLNRENLREFAEGTPVNEKFRNLVSHYYTLADEYHQKTYDVLRAVSPLLESRYKLSLEVIFNLYLMVFERIDIKNGSFTTEELNPTAEEIRDRVFDTIVHFNG